MFDMGSTLAELQVKIKADTAGLKTGLNNATNMIKQHNKAIGMAATAMGAAIVGAGVLSIKTYAQMGDEVQKMALRTGFTTEALSELRHAAEISGADLTTLEKGVKRMSGTILDASDGLETYIRTFDHLGLKVEDLMGLSPEEQFMKIASAIAEIEDPTMRAALAQDVFGRAGTELLPLFDQGADGIAALRQEAHDLGIVFDQEAANKAAAFTDAMHRVDESVSGLKMAIADNLIPALMPLIEKIQKIIVNVSDWMKANPELAKAVVLATMAIGGLLLVLGPLLIMLPGIIAMGPLVGAAFTMMLGPVGLIIAGIAALIAIGILVWKNWDTIKEKAIEIWNNIVNFFKDIWESITDIFSKHWDKILAILFPAVGIPILIARNWAAIKDALLAPIQAAALGIQNAINFIIRQINRLSFEVPDWVPGIGGEKFGFNISEITLPSFKGWEGRIPGQEGQPYLAEVHGGEYISQSPAGEGITNNFNIAELHVREEADVGRIARELHRLQLLRGTSG